MLIVLGRTFFASLALVFFIIRQTPRVPAKTHGLFFILLGLILAVHWSTFFHAIQISTVAIGLLSFSTFPVFVTFMEPHFFNEKLRFFDIVTAFCVFFGLAMVVPAFDFSNHMTRGVFWGTMSGLTFAVLSLLNRKYVKIYAPSLIAFYQNIFATLFLSPFIYLTPWSFTRRDLALLASLGIFCTALAHGLFIKGLRHTRAQLASLTTCLEPVYGIIFALLLLGEIPKMRTAIGGLVIIGTLVLASLKAQTGSVKAPHHS